MLAWCLFAAYLVATAWLGWKGGQKTGDFKSFAIGAGNMHPFVVGVTLAASTASASTFIINPGFIYVDGFSAWFHIVPSIGIGLMVMLTVLSFRFRRLGSEAGAVTIPDWIGKRYGNRWFALYFAALSLLLFAFVVLLVGGISIVMQSLLGVSNTVSLLITLTFVTGYVFLGGTYAHVFTNMLQGCLMIGVTLLTLAVGAKLAWWDGIDIAASIRQQDPTLLSAIKRDGALFNDVFSIYISGFVVGAVLCCQPHILTKALYVKDDTAVRNYLLVFLVVFGLFSLLGTTGLIARAVLTPDQIVSATTGEFRQDLVMTTFLETQLPDWVFVMVSVVLLAAAMSTLDGLLVSISTIVANDVVGQVWNADKVDARKRLQISHGVLVVIAIAAFLINLEPPQLLGVFGQVGVYGLALASAPALLAGVSKSKTPLAFVWACSLIGVGTHVLLYFWGAELFPNSPMRFANPGVTAGFAGLFSLAPIITWQLLTRRK